MVDISYPSIRPCQLELKLEDGVVQEKIDGINLGIYYSNYGEILFLTRNKVYTPVEFPFPMISLSIFKQVMPRLMKPTIMNADAVVVFGELTRPTFRTGYIYGQRPRFFAFDIVVLRKHEKVLVPPYAVPSFAEELGLDAAPVIERFGGPIKNLEIVKAVLSNAFISRVNPNALAEGIIIKSTEVASDPVDPFAKRIVCKLKQHPGWLNKRLF